MRSRSGSNSDGPLKFGVGVIYDGRIASGDWNQRVSSQSFIERELVAILMALRSFGALL